ncbi:MAG: hypothetical protein LQ338_005121 [Usnochroma carphineum]|nr:MAG: hypothetical protein LQ338_005121 [Usnochroma carphineum]
MSLTRAPRETYDEVVAELDRTRRSHADLRARHSSLVEERNRCLEERDQAHRAAAESTARCRQLESEIQRLHDQLADVTRRERDLTVDLESTRNDLRRARQTIQVQSKAIEGGRPAAASSTSQQPAAGAVARWGQDYGFGVKPVAVNRPDPREQLFAPPQPAPGPSSSMTMPHSMTSLPRVEWASEFSTLFNKVERFCQDYLNIPMEEADQEWPLTLADNIARESSPEHVTALVQDRRTRYLLLTRIVLTWIESHCFHVKIIKGFNRDSDKRVQDLHHRLRTAPAMSPLRRGFAQAEADTIMELTQQPGFADWRVHQVRRGVNSLLSRLEDTIAPGMHMALLGTTFESILGEAWRVGLLLATRTVDVHMWFPPSSEATLFNPRCMLNRNPYGLQGWTPEELEKRGARVALGVTPHITVTDVMAEKMETVTVHLANVVLRP